ncbi:MULTISPECIES: hypothetical protein [Paenibacillus]|uniref:hypothetical protein n=1 Tax=Paenibacillus TaxID=44249 RepID=UPI00038FFCFE|nr:MULTISPECIES: hypothetical protein [Paenibacillus]CDN44101.1 hypothetical protein BN871_EE_00070 [Paenibacillus sp. P22]SIP93739.1 hypothetical protein SAMN05880555_0033 [Paenibacillus sp. RU4X]SIQ12262.1 hypothetical protein SAMN05880570_0033 [Paenibacillus sp. RU4T]
MSITSTYDKATHRIQSNLETLIRQYFIDESTNTLLPIRSYTELSSETKRLYKPLTKGALARLAGVRPNVITEICHLQRGTLNIYHLSSIAEALKIKDINEIIELK